MSASDFASGNFSDAPSGSDMKDPYRHLDALFALAQVLTLDAEKASRLVEATYLHAHKQTGRDRLAIEDRRYLLQLLLQIFHHQNDAPRQLFATESEAEPSPFRSTTHDSFKQRLLDQFFKQAVPVAFATLNHAERTLLTLCEVERLSCADAALIVGGDSDTVCAQLQAARLKLQKLVVDNAPPAESKLLDNAEIQEWITTILRKTVKSDFAALPPTLEPRIKSSIQQAGIDLSDRPPVKSHLPSKSSNDQAHPVRNRTIRGLMTVILILGTGMVGYFGSKLLAREPESNLVILTVSKAADAEPLLATEDLDEAQQFVRQQMNWRLSLPLINEANLTGVGISEIAPSIRVPVFLYRNTQEEQRDPITVYAFTYALLDRYQGRIELEKDVLTAIASEDHFDLHDLSDKDKVLIWRHEDDIFMAVTSGDARALRERIQAR